jgi:hypothetical protein
MGALVTVLIQNMPGIIDLARQLFAQNHPTEPVPTDEEVIAAYQQALASSLAKDQIWLDAHQISGDGDES